MKLSFPISTFNAHTYFFVISEKHLRENMQKTLRTTKNLFNNWENQSQAVRKQFFCNAKLWHPEFGVTFGQQSQAKIDIM